MRGGVGHDKGDCFSTSIRMGIWGLVNQLIGEGGLCHSGDVISLALIRLAYG